MKHVLALFLTWVPFSSVFANDAEQAQPNVELPCSSVFFLAGEYIPAGQDAIDKVAFGVGDRETIKIHATQSTNPIIYAIDTKKLESDGHNFTLEESNYFQPELPAYASQRWRLPEGSVVLGTVDIVDLDQNETYLAVPASEPKPDKKDDFWSYLILFGEEDGQAVQKGRVPLGSGKIVASLDLDAYFDRDVRPNTVAMLRQTDANSFIFSIFEVVPREEAESGYGFQIRYMEVLESRSANSPGYTLGTFELNDRRYLAVTNEDLEKVNFFNVETMKWDPATFQF